MWGARAERETRAEPKQAGSPKRSGARAESRSLAGARAELVHEGVKALVKAVGREVRCWEPAERETEPSGVATVKIREQLFQI